MCLFKALATRVEKCDAAWSAGPVEGPQAGRRIGGVSPLSLLTFFAAAKKVSAAPHRGNACSTDTKPRMPAKPKKHRYQIAEASAAKSKKTKNK
ncbi:hypothetical protein [Paraburkholderia azotifigens]|uniref:Uncharacterized protein n=1 Tax=Paraburkholderia azotifigens TaxID=2057004 RepID=A0ABU9R9Y8_9BURK